jgi:hypothetical protein
MATDDSELDPDLTALTDAPIQRPGLRHLLWYVYGGSLPERNWTWVLHDTTCRTWAVRHFARTFAIIVPLLAAWLLFVPASLGLRLITGLTFAGGIFMFMLVNTLVDTDRRAVRAGYPSGFVTEIRGQRAEYVHHLAVLERRNRTADRRARQRGR